MTNKKLIPPLLLACGLTAIFAMYATLENLEAEQKSVFIKRYYEMNEPIVDDGVCAKPIEALGFRPVFLQGGVSEDDKGVYLRVRASELGGINVQWRKIDASSLTDAELALYNKEPMELTPKSDAGVSADWAYEKSTKIKAGVVQTCLVN
ncbi:hypothetical protein [Vibrio atlanticus]|uniref:hypothetical protein n=1 Tax=Vibrio atlanticus TaxID=693153 RepID=UPI0035527575